MIQSKAWGACALAFVLTACGGGRDGPESSHDEFAQLPQAAAQSRPARLAATAPAPSTDLFFDWAERNFAQLFPEQRPSQSLPPYVYRFYPSTQIYLAVADGEVYGLGPITNNQVVALGKLSDYACAVNPVSCDPAAAASAALATPTSGKTAWNITTPITVTLQDSAGRAVNDALSCTSVNTVALSVAADCSSVTGRRLGQHTFTVSSGNISAVTSIKVIPQAQPIGTLGSTKQYNLVVTPTGKVLAWGSNADGALGQGKPYSVLTNLTLPTPVKDQAGTGELSGIVAVSAGDNASALALTEDGEVWSWGASGALGRTAINGDVLPGKVRNAADNGSLSGVVAVAVGDDNAIALADDGTVYSWGNYAGQQDPSNGKKLPGQVSAVSASGVLSNVVAISAGWNWSAALTADGRVVTWGYDANTGQTGQGLTTTSVDRPGYVLRDSDGAAIEDIVAISAGYNFGLALTRGGQVYAWGSNSYGQIGQNTEYNVKSRALLVKDDNGAGQLSNIKMVSAGGWHALALDQNGKVFSWGLATSGELGDGPNRPVLNRSLLPRAVVSELGTGQLSTISAITAGYSFSLALANDGNLLIWGDAFSGKLGQGSTSTTDLSVPTKVKDTVGTSALSLTPMSTWPNLTRLGR